LSAAARLSPLARPCPEDGAGPEHWIGQDTPGERGVEHAVAKRGHVPSLAETARTRINNLAPISDHNHLSRGSRWGFAASLVIAIGSIGPWIDLGSESAGGLDQDGAVTLALALVAAAYVVFTPRPHWAPLAALGALAGVVAVIDILDIVALWSPGWGLYLTAIGGVGLFLSAVFATRTDSPTPAPPG
jgi:hypothetical protein